MQLSRRPYSIPAMSAGASPPSQEGKSGSESALAGADRVYFSTFDVTEQVFLRTPHVIGIVNLKPIVPCRKYIVRRSTLFCAH